MKRSLHVCLLSLALVALLLSGCGNHTQEAPAGAPDMKALYDAFMNLEDMPGMIAVPEDRLAMIYGIESADCAQAVVAVCEDSLRADELWLIEAKDAGAAKTIGELARTRAEQKAEELRDYLPDQFKVAEKAKILEKGNCVYLIISPMADAIVDKIS